MKHRDLLLGSTCRNLKNIFVPSESGINVSAQQHSFHPIENISFLFRLPAPISSRFQKTRQVRICLLLNSQSSVADPGSRIRCLFDPCIRNPGSGMGKKNYIRNREEHPGSYFRELRNNFLG